MGDGDTKSYVNVKDTYPGNEIKKLECFGHCKKSWNTIMKSKKKERGLGDRGCLTDLLLTNYRIMQVLPANKMLDTLKYDIKLHPIKITRITIHIALLAQIVGANIMLIEQITPKLYPWPRSSNRNYLY